MGSNWLRGVTNIKMGTEVYNKKRVNRGIVISGDENTCLVQYEDQIINTGPEETSLDEVSVIGFYSAEATAQKCKGEDGNPCCYFLEGKCNRFSKNHYNKQGIDLLKDYDKYVPSLFYPYCQTHKTHS